MSQKYLMASQGDGNGTDTKTDRDGERQVNQKTY
jgi:hypothetical protein